jgi:hypothetical protein
MCQTATSIGVRGDHLLDPGVQFSDVGGEGVDAAQMNACVLDTQAAAGGAFRLGSRRLHPRQVRIHHQSNR